MPIHIKDGRATVETEISEGVSVISTFKANLRLNINPAADPLRCATFTRAKLGESKPIATGHIHPGIDAGKDRPND